MAKSSYQKLILNLSPGMPGLMFSDTATAEGSHRNWTAGKRTWDLREADAEYELNDLHPPPLELLLQWGPDSDPLVTEQEVLYSSKYSRRTRIAVRPRGWIVHRAENWMTRKMNFTIRRPRSRSPLVTQFASFLYSYGETGWSGDLHRH